MGKDDLVLLVLSCDAYSDLWDDFFNLKEKFWKDCPYKFYLVTESKTYNRSNVEVILCGNNLNWAGRLKYAIDKTNAKYYGIFLEDYFISSPINNSIIFDLLETMKQHNVTFLNTSDVFYNCINMKNKEYFLPHLIKIPNNKKYGLSTEAGIWERNFLLDKIGHKDYSAWQFEIDRVNEAKTETGLGGFNLCDDRMPFHVSIEPVVIQGKIYPPARKFFHKIGYNFISNRQNMNYKNVLIFKLKSKMSNIKYGKKLFKWIGEKFLGQKFFT